MEFSTTTTRPRNVDWKRAAAILYGDWGTSKAYVIGLAFAVAGYSSPWLIAAMCLLTALVGFNYMAICRLYPNGGGVYASVRHRSEIISIVGAFLLIADYIVTAAVSALSAFLYLGVPHPEWFAGASIVIIGALNYFGPKHTGGAAVLIAVPTAIVVVLLGALVIPHLGEAVAHIEPLHGSFLHNWNAFVAIVLALSGVEAIANSTGVMKLDPGSTLERPVVTKTANKAILVVMLEVCLFTALLGLAMDALPGLVIHHSTDGPDVNAPGAENVRDYMLRYMAQIFAGNLFGPVFGHIAAWTVSIVFGVLLLSAVNTAIVALSGISFLMARDQEMPPIFAKLNSFGVPNAGLLFAVLVPAGLVIAVSDMSGLADLYAVGVVGAIATNLGATCTDWKLALKKHERAIMFITFGIMAAIEISLFIDKPNARIFAVTILAIGLILRGLARESAQRKTLAAHDAALEAAILAVEKASKPSDGKLDEAAPSSAAPKAIVSTGTAAAPAPVPKAYNGPILVAVRGQGRTLDFAVREARENGQPLYVLFVREQPIIAPGDRRRKWTEDQGAKETFESLRDKGLGETIIPCYAVSDAPAITIADLASTIGAERVLLGAPQRNTLIHMLRGNIIREVASLLPDDITLLVCV
jgi:amino acid transporter